MTDVHKEFPSSLYVDLHVSATPFKNSAFWKVPVERPRLLTYHPETHGPEPLFRMGAYVVCDFQLSQVPLGRN